MTNSPLNQRGTRRAHQDKDAVPPRRGYTGIPACQPAQALAHLVRTRWTDPMRYQRGGGVRVLKADFMSADGRPSTHRTPGWSTARSKSPPRSALPERQLTCSTMTASRPSTSEKTWTSCGVYPFCGQRSQGKPAPFLYARGTPGPLPLCPDLFCTPRPRQNLHLLHPVSEPSDPSIAALTLPARSCHSSALMTVTTRPGASGVPR